jgi:hypothetical protein
MHKYFLYIKDNNTRIFFLNANLNKNFFFPLTFFSSSPFGYAVETHFAKI